MKYVALLRGINVGGTNRVSMAELKAAFEATGVTGVSTYINSGNVVFSTDEPNRALLATHLRETVRERTAVDVSIQLRDERELGAVVDAIPSGWANNDAMKCDVVFLDAEADRADILDDLGPRPGIEDALYVPGAVVWRIDRTNASRNRLTRMVGTPLYGHVTVRNCTTTRALLELLRA